LNNNKRKIFMAIKLPYEEIKSKRPDLMELRSFDRFPVSVIAENVRACTMSGQFSGHLTGH
jgi:hypothetical protein